MQKRLPMEGFFKELQLLNPKFALDKNNNNIHKAFPNVCGQYETPFAFSEHELNVLKEYGAEQFWAFVHNCKDGSDDLKFPQLTVLTKILLVMRHSNAECERIFSIVTDCKPKKRNRLGAQTLNAMAVYRSSMQAKKLTCCTFNVLAMGGNGPGKRRKRVVGWVGSGVGVGAGARRGPGSELSSAGSARSFYCHGGTARGPRLAAGAVGELGSARSPGPVGRKKHGFRSGFGRRGSCSWFRANFLHRLGERAEFFRHRERF
jgi:hypothetical protein